MKKDYKSITDSEATYPTIIKSFLNKEKALFINNYLRSSKLKGQLNGLGLRANAEDFGVGPKKDLSNINDPNYKIIHHELNKAFQEILSLFYQDYEIEPGKLSFKNSIYYVMLKGAHGPEHIDEVIELGIKEYENPGEILCYSALLYLNNDYKGGEIYFPKVNMSIHPEPGDLIYFRGDNRIPHGINEILDGERCNIIIFFEIFPSKDN